MTKRRSSIFPRKLGELERLVNDISHIQQENPGFQLGCEDIEQRLSFLKSLLSAEIASHPSQQHHLEHMSQRVKELEASFRGWRTGSVTSTSSTLDHVDNFDDVNYEYEDDDDDASKCYCNESCLEDEEDDVSDDLKSTLGQEKEGVCEDYVAEEEDQTQMVIFSNDLFEEMAEDHDDDRFEELSDDNNSGDSGGSDQDEKQEIEEKRIWDELKAEVARELKWNEKRKKKKNERLGFGKLCVAVASGIVIGMFLMGSLEYDGYGGNGNLLVPT